MDRVVIYSGQIPLEQDLLNTNRNTMVALGKLAKAMLGTDVVNGLAVSPTSPASLSVAVASGEIYQTQNVDNSAYSSLAADTTHTIVKQGILADGTTLSCPAPATTGFSICYLIEASFQEVDTGNVVLPYYNAANPQQAFSGPANSGAAQATDRAGRVVLQAKAGIAATTGTQVAPAADAGYVGLAIVTVANGQSTITSGNIVVAPGSKILSQSLLDSIGSGRLLGVTTFTATGVFTPNPKAITTRVRGCGAGGGSGAAGATGSTTASASCGGASGACMEVLFFGQIAGPQAVVIGVGGTAATTTAAPGGDGGNTSLGSLLTLPGGSGGDSSVAAAPPFVQAPVSFSLGSPTTTGTVLWQMSTGIGGNGIALGTTTHQQIPGQGRDCPFGKPASGYGAGGTGNANAASASMISGNAGNGGLLIIEEYA